MTMFILHRAMLVSLCTEPELQGSAFRSLTERSLPALGQMAGRGAAAAPALGLASPGVVRPAHLRGAPGSVASPCLVPAEYRAWHDSRTMRIRCRRGPRSA